jgi:hypothetical protein
MKLFGLYLFLPLLILHSLTAEEPQFRFQFRILHADFVDSGAIDTAQSAETGLSLYYQANGSFEAIRTEPWIPSEYMTYEGGVSMGLYVKDESVEGGFRRVLSFEAKEWWKRVLLVVYSDASRSRYKGRPVVFTKKQRKTPGLHAFNLSSKDMQVTLGGASVQLIKSGKMLYFPFPESDDHRYRIQAAVQKGERWRKIVSAKRYLDPSVAYFSIFCQPKIGKASYSVRLVTLE